MTSFVNDKYGRRYRWKHPVRNDFLLFIFSGQKDVAQIPFTLWYVQYMVTSVLQEQQYMFNVRSLLVEEKALLMKKDK